MLAEAEKRDRCFTKPICHETDVSQDRCFTEPMFHRGKVDSWSLEIKNLVSQNDKVAIDLH
jgi:hypothetical protein